MIYLDNAATTNKKPKSVLYQTMKELRNSANAGRGGHLLSMKAAEKIYHARENIARLIYVNDAENIVFTHNATYALNMAIKGCVKKGDHIIISSLEHNSVLRPVVSLCECTYSIVKANDDGFLCPDDFKNEMRENTSVVVITHASNVFGTIQPVKEIIRCVKEYPVTVILDCAQTLGAIEVDEVELGADIIAFTGHKSLFGPQGTGGLYVKKGTNITSIIQGGTGSFSMLETQPEELPELLESGTLNGAGICGLNAGVDFILREGIDAIFDHNHYLTEILIHDLKNISCVKTYCDTGNRTSVLSFNIAGVDSIRASNILSDQYRIYLRGGFHCSKLAHETMKTDEFGTVRASIGYFNTKFEVKKLVDAVYRISKEI